MASKRRLRRKACEGKKPLTFEQAQSMIYNLRRKNPTTGTLNAYHCKWGSHYHVGHAPTTHRPGIWLV